MATRDEKKNQRRQKRLQKRAQHQRPQRDDAAFGVLQELSRHVPDASFPGCSDPSMSRPDMLKYLVAMMATEQEPGRSKYRDMKKATRQGLLGDLPGFVDDWIIEEFLCHGVPGDSWHPIDAFLAQAGERFPPAAAQQFQLWKTAQIGLYEARPSTGNCGAFRPWEPIREMHSGPPQRAIALNLGGPSSYWQIPGGITLTYFAPWAPADNLYCAMGFGRTMPKQDVGHLLFHLGLRHPEVVCRPLPWNRPGAAADYRRQWQQREWHGWLRERLEFPFWAIIGTPPEGKPKLLEVTDLLPSTPFDAKQFGIYMNVPWKGGFMATGGTMAEPFDVTSPNALPLAEYRAYRAHAGPPPGVRGKPTFLQVRN